MSQILLHLIGDYLTQSDWMAQNKTKAGGVAAIHAAVYSLPFLLLANSVWAWAAIFWTHLLIDRFRLARYVVFAKNFLAPRSAWPKWADCKVTGYPSSTPPFMAIWLMIIADNTLHLSINYAALRWL